ncbi:MAG: VCBS repeat-containing protein [Ignavibacteriales bacterium]|nr:VCBS repeat-containing protein [Ignavibacteriales bacterium]
MPQCIYKLILVCFSLTLLSCLITAQTYSQRYILIRGDENPFELIGDRDTPRITFADLDNDGDKDALIGFKEGQLRYFENIGSVTQPNFVEKTGNENPFDGFNLGSYLYPEFVDIDNDMDLDVFIGNEMDKIKYLKNVGNSNIPEFIIINDDENPFFYLNFLQRSTPEFVDIDSDGDYDVFCGEIFPGVRYYENTGTPAQPEYLDWGYPYIFITEYNTNIDFVDIDKDGDYDAFIGAGHNNGVLYYKNIGSVFFPKFVNIIGNANPLNEILVDNWTAPEFVDIDGDNDDDCFVGYLSDIRYYKNISPTIISYYPPDDSIDIIRNSDLTMLFDDTINVNIGKIYLKIKSDDSVIEEIDVQSSEVTGSGTTFIIINPIKDLPANTEIYVQIDSGAFQAPEGINYSGFSGSEYWNFSTNDIVPVELTTFTATAERNAVSLNWQTATETNNSGFEIERKQVGSPQSSVGNQDWNQIAFVPGFGTTTEPKSYSFTDENLSSGKYQYRLKQIDFDGTFEYSNTVEVEINSPTEFSLGQNYPNPFNPTTRIKYTIPSVTLSLSKGDILVSLKVFDVLGNEIATLVNEPQRPGSYEVEFNSAKLSSGVYYYQIKSGNFLDTKKMVLIR